MRSCAAWAAASCPSAWPRPYIDTGRLVVKKTERAAARGARQLRLARRHSNATGPRAAVVAGAAGEPGHAAAALLERHRSGSVKSVAFAQHVNRYQLETNMSSAHERTANTSPSSAPAWPASPAPAPWCRPATRSPCSKKAAAPAGAWPPAAPSLAASTTARSTSPCAIRALSRRWKPRPACAAPGAPTAVRVLDELGHVAAAGLPTPRMRTGWRCRA